MSKLIGPQDPPNDPIIFNRRRPDGTFPPLSEFFEGEVIKALRERREQILRAFETRLFAGGNAANALIRELAEIEHELGENND